LSPATQRTASHRRTPQEARTRRRRWRSLGSIIVAVRSVTDQIRSGQVTSGSLVKVHASTHVTSRSDRCHGVDAHSTGKRTRRITGGSSSVWARGRRLFFSRTASARPQLFYTSSYAVRDVLFGCPDPRGHDAKCDRGIENHMLSIRLASLQAHHARGSGCGMYTGGLPFAWNASVPPGKTALATGR
jgi:hypothetical protein